MQASVPTKVGTHQSGILMRGCSRAQASVPTKVGTHQSGILMRG